MTLDAGARLGSYEILSPLGSGGMAEVYRARDTRLGRQVAIKVLPEDLAADESRLTRFEREARLLASVNHPNIATLFGFETAHVTLGLAARDQNDDATPKPAPSVCFLAMELVEGESLASRLKRGRLPTDEAAAVFLQVARGLEAAHERGIVHRDLKPANIVGVGETGRVAPEGSGPPGITRFDAGRVKILDFGIAKGPATEIVGVDQSVDTATGAALGTPGYMSPEQARGQPVDKRTDIWSFGCVLFEALSGRPPFQGDTPADRLVAMLTTRPDLDALPDDVPGPMRRLLERCLEADPAKRLRDIGEARLHLEGVLESALGADTVVTGFQLASRLRRLRRSPVSRRLAVAALVALLGGGGWWVWDTQVRSGRSADVYERLAVLPFDNLTGDPELEPLASGIAEVLVSREVGWWPVVPYITSAKYRGSGACHAADALQAGFVVGGTLRRAGDDLRATAQLVKCPTGELLWSESFESGVGEVFPLEEEIASRIYASMARRLEVTAQTPRPGSAFWYLHQRTRADNARAEALFRGYLEQEPDEANRWTQVYYTLLQSMLEQWTASPEATLAEMERVARGCLDVNPRHANCQWIAGLTAYFKGERVRALAAFERMTVLANDLPMGHGMVGMALALSGREQGAIAELETARRLSPDDPFLPGWIYYEGLAHFSAQRYEEARRSARQAIAYNVNDMFDHLASTYQLLAAAEAQLGHLEEAHAALDEALRLRPGLTLRWASYVFTTANPESQERYRDGLRKAGLGD